MNERNDGPEAGEDDGDGMHEGENGFFEFDDSAMLDSALPEQMDFDEIRARNERLWRQHEDD